MEGSTQSGSNTKGKGKCKADETNIDADAGSKATAAAGKHGIYAVAFVPGALTLRLSSSGKATKETKPTTERKN